MTSSLVFHQPWIGVQPSQSRHRYVSRALQKKSSMVFQWCFLYWCFFLFTKKTVLVCAETQVIVLVIIDIIVYFRDFLFRRRNYPTESPPKLFTQFLLKLVKARVCALLQFQQWANHSIGARNL